ncbi:MAG: gamma-glutamylcyclotransferase family protein, partial [Methanosarcinales archaeon]
MVLYFAYGSNMDLDRIKSRGVVIKRRFSGILFGWKLLFNKIKDMSEGTGYANIISNKNSKVEGIIYEIDKQFIKNLDRAEGYPHHYTKKILIIKDKYGKKFDCIVYIANPEMIKDGLRPT